MSTAAPTTEGASTGRRVSTVVTRLHDVVGAHPDALAKIYASGKPTDPSELGDAPRGRMLALEPAGDLFIVARSLVRALETDALPWRGKVFDHGGNSGKNVVFGRRVFRFRTAVGPSSVDGRPTLKLTYDDPAFKNPWPVNVIEDELRTVADGIAIGPASLVTGGARRRLLWFGLER